MAPIKHTVTIMDTVVHYWEYHPKKPTTIVMIHGFRGTHHGLEKIAGELKEYRLLIPDLPGFGASQAFLHQPHTVAAYARFVDAFIRSLHLKEPPVLLGHSFGSVICSQLAATHPVAINKLILINPIGSPALEGPRGLLTRLAVAYYWLGRSLPPKLSRVWLAAPPIVTIMSVAMTKTKDKATRTYIHDQHRQHFSSFADSQVAAEGFKASITHDVSQIAQDIMVPTLLIVGELDDITPLAKQQQLATKLPNATLAIITDVGHLIHYEKAAEAARQIHAFLRQ